MDHESHIISEQVFGSSKKLQFIGLSPMDSLLSAIDSAHPIRLPKPETSAKRNMSIESMLASDATFELDHQHRHHERSCSFSSTSSSSTTSTASTAAKRAWLSAPYDDRLHKHRRYENEIRPSASPLQQQGEPKRLITVTCLHAAVAQKSYGSEKRFLCPPPTIAIQQHHQEANCPAVTMSVLAEGTERPVEQRTSLDENNCGNFKYLHVTGSAKTKQFCLKVNMCHSSASTATTPAPAFATFFSSPIAIISKPSKKTAKARNVSSCIFTTSQISLFNRINSQTVRTKYLTSAPSEKDQQQQELCAKNSSWSAFDIILVRQPSPPPQHTLSQNHHHYHHHHQPSVTAAGVPLAYGTEIILKDSQTGVCSPPVIIRKVDKGAISTDAFGPVSQMQKIALQLSSVTDRPVYLSANGNAIQELGGASHESDDNNSSGNGINHTHASTWLDYCVSKPATDQAGVAIEKVDDYLCWTIVGIAKFEYTIEEPVTTTTTTTTMAPSPPLTSVSHPSPEPPSKYRSSPPEIMPRLPSPPCSPPRTIVPFPMVSGVTIDTAKHALQLTGQHLVQHLPTSPYPHLLEFWLGGAHGPLFAKTSTTTGGCQQLLLALPPTQDFLVTHHDLLKTTNGTRAIELPLLMVRKDNVVYHSGKSVTCHVNPNGDTHWSIMDVTVQK